MGYLAILVQMILDIRTWGTFRTQQARLDHAKSNVHRMGNEKKRGTDAVKCLTTRDEIVLPYVALTRRGSYQGSRGTMQLFI